MKILLLFAILLISLSSYKIQAQEISETRWNSIQIAPEARCSPYNRKDYPYSQILEKRIIEQMGGIYSPYTLRYHHSPLETDIEHIVAVSEAHDSGLCNASIQTKKRFSNDLLNITLATPQVNRCWNANGKCGKDAGRWIPPENKCWFANQVIQVKQKYSLTADPREILVLRNILERCPSTEMIFPEKSIN